MAGIDKFLSSSLTEKIKKNLDPKILKNVERELFLDCGMSIKLSIEHFGHFIDILKKNSGMDINKFQKDCFNEIIQIKKHNDRYSLKIIDDSLSDKILQLAGDSESRKILLTIFENDLPIPDILKKSNVPKTSGYRKIENMILNGIIIETGRILSDSKKVSKFKCCFDEIKVNLNKNKTETEVIFNSEIFEKSSCLKIFSK